MEDFEAYIAQLFKKLYVPLVNHSNKLVKDVEAAREVVQETFVHLLEKGDSLHIKTSEEAYLYTAVRNRSLNYLKAQMRQLNRQGELHETYTATQDLNIQGVEAADLARILDVAIESLSKKTQVIFRLSRDESLSYKEISEQLGISVKTVEFHISSALKTIRSFLEKHWYLPVIFMLYTYQ
ncbi:RNA polymerase sigma-70 factor [Microscilla marina]|uniref:RNA polymerase ECF-type sigma factor n=1 Tax=Microscilla marina ATCC 23134 TaxID=313606 RepID=A1ZZH6_MICM2|nr:RNA polymerase sigma-70 factor [Microscilla marina]EAY24222.1 RNA polymerase ECF-type sigma factor [Microscilla marina ATCC 23134]